MNGMETLNKRFAWLPALYLIIGAMLTFGGTVFSELYLIPSKEMRVSLNKQREYRLSKLYQPLLLATKYGNFSMTSDLIFYEIDQIMKNYGYLADQEVIDKYIEFTKVCRFAGYEDLVRGVSFKPGLSENVILEIIKQRKPPLMWTANSLESAVKIEKEFHELLVKYYEKARKNLM